MKYTWFGAGYISNMYYKWIANYATYDFDQGGDFSFTEGRNMIMRAKGDADGKPRNQTGWRASCMYLWGTPEGGPCVLRPTPSRAADSPGTELLTNECVAGYEEDWRPIISTKSYCQNAWADEDNVIHGAGQASPLAECLGPFSAVDMTDVTERLNRHRTGWSNMFAFPWEISAYWNFTTRSD